jgi:hypothetical protein
MPHSPGPMGSHISSKETNTGDLPMERRTQTIQNLSVKGLMAFQILLTLHLFGLGMERSISSKEQNIGDLTRTSGLQ